MKALGTGHTPEVLWRDVEVVRRGGPPQLQFHGGAADRFAAMGAKSSLLTITHSDALALAQVLLLGASNRALSFFRGPPASRATRRCRCVRHVTAPLAQRCYADDACADRAWPPASAA